MQPWEKLAGLFFNMEKTNILSNTDGFHLYGWMVNELHLEGGDLITFALVYTFTQSHAGIYKGNTAYLSAWTGWSTRCSRQHLAKLAEMGLIEEQRGTKDGTPYCYYTLGKNFIEPMKKIHSAYENISGGSMNNFQGRIDNIEKKKKNSNISLSPSTSRSPSFSLRSALLAAGVTAEVADAWLAVRKAKKAVNTELAWKAIEREIQKSGRSADECIRFSAERSWAGFKADWLKEEDSRKGPSSPTPSPKNASNKARLYDFTKDW